MTHGLPFDESPPGEWPGRWGPFILPLSGRNCGLWFAALFVGLRQCCPPIFTPLAHPCRGYFCSCFQSSACCEPALLPRLELTAATL